LIKIINNEISLLRQCFIEDKINYYAVILSICLSIIAYLIWQILSKNQLFVFYNPYKYYPLEFYSIIFFVNLLISWGAYKKNKPLSNLLMPMLAFFAFMIIILEIYYWILL